MSYSRILSVKYQAIRKYQAEEMSFVTLTSTLLIIFQSLIRFGGIVFDFGVHQNSILLHIYWSSIILSFHVFEFCYICSFSQTLCSLIFWKCAARLNFFMLWVVLCLSFNMLALCWLYTVAGLAKQMYNWGWAEENFLKHSNVLILFSFSANSGFIKGGWYLMNLKAFINFTSCTETL